VLDKLRAHETLICSETLTLELTLSAGSGALEVGDGSQIAVTVAKR